VSAKEAKQRKKSEGRMSKACKEFVIQSAKQIDDTLRQDTLLRQNIFAVVRVGAWRDDSTLKIIISDFKKQSQIVSQSFVKLALLISPSSDFESNIMKSIFDEVREQLQLLLNIYWRCLECSLAICFFDYLSQATRSLFDQIQQLLEIIPSKDKPSINYITGMITKIVENIEKLPSVNKTAYRRYLMEKCLTVKETVEEFDGYLQSSLTNGMNALGLDGEAGEKEKDDDADDEDDDEEDDEGDDDGEDEREYTKDEFDIVSKQVEVFKITLELIKLSMNMITEVGDRINDEAANVTAEDTLQRKKWQTESDQWIATVVRQVGVIEGALIDAGAELYPPVRADDDGFQLASETLLSQVTVLCTKLSDCQTSLGPFISKEKLESLEKYKSSLHITNS